MKTVIKNYLNWFWSNPNYGHNKDLKIGNYKIHIIQSMYDGKISDLIVYLYQGDDYTKGIRWDMSNKRQTNVFAEEIVENIK